MVTELDWVTAGLVGPIKTLIAVTVGTLTVCVIGVEVLLA